MKIYPRSKFKIPNTIRKRLMKVDPATIGHWLQFGFMDPRINAMFSDIKVLGTAFTVKSTAIDSVMVHKAVSLAKEGDVLIIDRNGDQKHACIGEIISYAAKIRKIAGIIVDGPITDIQQIKEIKVPIYATGISPVTTRLIGGEGEINSTIQCGGLSVNPGDIILGDDNGILVLSKDEDIEYWLDMAEQKESKEITIKEKLDKGELLSSLTNADKLLRDKGVI